MKMSSYYQGDNCYNYVQEHFLFFVSLMDCKQQTFRGKTIQYAKR